MQDKTTLKQRYGYFDLLGWLAATCSHIPDRAKQVVRYQRFCKTIRVKSSNGNLHSNFKPTVADL